MTQGLRSGLSAGGGGFPEASQLLRARGHPGFWKSATRGITALGICSPNHTVSSLLPTVMSSVKPCHPTLKAALPEWLSTPSPPCSATSLLSAALPWLETSLSMLLLAWNLNVWYCCQLTGVSSAEGWWDQDSCCPFCFSSIFSCPFLL